jgi:hypothetical protein
VALLSRLVALVRFLALPAAGLAFGAVLGLGVGLFFIGKVVAGGGLAHAGHAGPIVLALLAFPPAIAGIVGANGGYLLALVVDGIVILARRRGASAPRRVAKLTMLVVGIAIAVAFRVAAGHDGDDVIGLLAHFILAGGGLVPASLAAGGLAAAIAHAVAVRRGRSARTSAGDVRTT